MATVSKARLDTLRKRAYAADAALERAAKASKGESRYTMHPKHAGLKKAKRVYQKASAAYTSALRLPLANPDSFASSRGAAWLAVQRAEGAYAKSARESGDSAETKRLQAAYKDAVAKLRAMRRPNPKKSAGIRKKNVFGERKNPDQAEIAAAGKMYERFHGKPAGRARTINEALIRPDVLADCGRLVELHVKRPGVKEKYFFKGSGPGAVRVATTPAGGDLYFVGGDQEINLAGLGSAKAQMDLGEVTKIVYFTSKDFHNFEPSEYGHKFGEVIRNGARVMDETAERPRLGYDALSKRLYLVGGSYQVKRAGIVR